MEANTYSLWQGHGFKYLFSLLSKVHVRWVSHCGLSITSSIPLRSTGENRAGNSSSFSSGHLFIFYIHFVEDDWVPEGLWIKKRDKEGGPSWRSLHVPCLVWLLLSLLISETHLSHRSPYTPPNPGPPSPSTVKYWLSDNGPLVECIYYASVVDNPPKWASKRWLVDVFSNFSSSPRLPYHHHPLSLVLETCLSLR